MVGGTTCIQGNPRGATPPDGDLVRNIDSEKFNTNQDYIRVRTIVADDLADLQPIIAAIDQGRGFICHAAEGTQPTLRQEFTLLNDAGLIREQLMVIHGVALIPADFAVLAAGDATLVWSPFSNLWLYGATADITAANAAGVRICLGSDWAPSGTRNVLWELKVADLWNQAQPTPVFTDQELARLVTANPGQALSGVWPHPLGTIQPGALADLIVVARRHPDPYRNLIQATETDIRLVLVGGHPRYGTRPLMAAAGATAATQIRIGRLTRAIDYGDATITWAKVLAELERVHTNPQQAVQAGRRRPHRVRHRWACSRRHPLCAAARHAHPRTRQPRGRARGVGARSGPLAPAHHHRPGLVRRRRRQPLPRRTAVGAARLRMTAWTVLHHQGEMPQVFLVNAGQRTRRAATIGVAMPAVSSLDHGHIAAHLVSGRPGAQAVISAV